MNEQNRIQYYRKRAGLSQEELGERLYVSRQTVSQWETGQTVPSVDSLARLREIFGVSIDELLGLTPAPDETPAEASTEASAGAQAEALAEETPARAPYVFRYTEDDFRALNRVHRRAPRFVLIATVVMTVAFGLASVSGGGNLWGFGFFAALALLSALRYRTVKKLEVRAGSYALTRIYAYTLTAQGISVTMTDVEDPDFIHRRMLTGITRARTYGDLRVLYTEDGFYTLRLSELAVGDPLSTYVQTAPPPPAASLPKTPAKPAPRRLPKGVRVLSVVLTILSVLSLFGGMMLADFLSDQAGGSVTAFLDCMWVLFLFLPLPIGSFVLGMVLRRRGCNGTGLMAVGVVMVIFLCLFGSFSLLMSVAEDPVAVVEGELGIDIPAYEYYNSSTSAGLSEDDLVSVATLHFTDTDGAAFEAAMAPPSPWLTALPAELEELQPPHKEDIDFDRILLYDRTAGRYNARPAAGGDMVALYYDEDYNILTIVLYRWEN